MSEAAVRNMRFAVLGAGKMAGILLQAFLEQGLLTTDQISATVQHPERARALTAEWGFEVTTDNLEAARNADVILLGVKPVQVPVILREIAPVLTSAKMLISVAASVTVRNLEDAAGCELGVVRAMPNTPTQVAAGVTALCAGRFLSKEQMDLAQHLFATVGRSVIVEEKHMDGVTALSGAGPAFLYIVIEALAEGGVHVGLPRDLAMLLAAQTALGSAKMVLERGIHPAALKDAVTTPAGCTVEGVMALEEGRLRATLIDAVRRTARRSRELTPS